MTQTGRYCVVGVGELLWDLLPAGKQLGGATANFAYHTNALGAQGILVSCVGNDTLGGEILNRLQSLKLDRRYVAVHPTAPTGAVEVRLDANGVPDFIIHRDVAWDCIPTDDALTQLARQADAACFGTLAQRGDVSRQTIRDFLAATRDDCLRVFDINLRQAFFNKEIVNHSLMVADVLKLNDAELPVVANMLGLSGTEADLIQRLIARYRLQMVALTRGSQGSRLYLPGKVFEHPGFPTNIADTVGAGDAFTAALTIGLLRRADPDQINEQANRLASFVCSRSGGTPEIPRDLLPRS